MAIETVLSDNPMEEREDIIFIGDTYNTDIKGAINAGIDAIWINHKKDRNIDNLPISIISHTNELIGIIKNKY